MAKRKNTNPPSTGPDRPKAVGYGKPPEEHRFKPGKSGNPEGRPKKVPNPDGVLAKYMGGTITVTDGGVQKKITRLDALLRQQFAIAIKGNSRAALSILQALRQHALDTAGTDSGLDFTLMTIEELTFLEGILNRNNKFVFEKEVAELKKKRGIKDEHIDKEK